MPLEDAWAVNLVELCVVEYPECVCVCVCMCGVRVDGVRTVSLQHPSQTYLFLILAKENYKNWSYFYGASLFQLLHGQLTSVC